MARTTFSGPVKSDNGFEGSITGNVVGNLVGSVDLGASGTLTTANPTAATTPASFSADRYIAIVGQNGTTYYIPVANAVW
jgi:hypothetical protein